MSWFSQIARLGLAMVLAVSIAAYFLLPRAIAEPRAPTWLDTSQPPTIESVGDPLTHAEFTSSVKQGFNVPCQTSAIPTKSGGLSPETGCWQNTGLGMLSTYNNAASDLYLVKNGSHVAGTFSNVMGKLYPTSNPDVFWKLNRRDIITISGRVWILRITSMVLKNIY